MTDPRTNTTQFTYDSANHLTQTTNPLNEVTRFEYDANGRLVTLIPHNPPATIFKFWRGLAKFTIKFGGQLTTIQDCNAPFHQALFK